MPTNQSVKHFWYMMQGKSIPMESHPSEATKGEKQRNTQFEPKLPINHNRQLSNVMMLFLLAAGTAYMAWAFVAPN